MSASESDNYGIKGNEDLRRVHDSMLEGLGQLSDYFGFTKIIGQLYGTLMLSPDPLSLDDMVERLDISKASVSMNMRTLEHLGMVRQVYVRGSSGRRKYYEAETDYWEIMRNFLSTREMRDIDRAIHSLEENSQTLVEAMDEMDDEDEDIARLYVQRMSQLQLLFEFARLMINSIMAQADVASLSKLDVE